jgi:nucleoid-associated protein YgaU
LKETEMNRDVKIGLAIGLLVLVGLFVWLAWKASREQNPIADISQRPPVKTTGPDLTTTQPSDKTGGVSAKDYFPSEESPKSPESGEVAPGPAKPPSDTKGTVEVGADHATTTEQLTPAARAYRDLLASRKAGEPALKTEELASRTGQPGTPAPGLTPETSASTPSSYVVKAGDTLGIISKKVYGSSHFWQRIAKANKIDDPARVHAGMALAIPALSDTERPHSTVPLKDKGVQPTVSLPADTTEQHHKVVAGDTLGSISRQYYGTSRKTKLIMDANKITDASRLFVGKDLIIPKVSTASSSDHPGRVSLADVGGEYVVKDGDTFAAISRQFYGSPTLYAPIMKANKLDTDRDLVAGRKLIIPPRPSEAELAEESPRGDTHVAKAPKESSGTDTSLAKAPKEASKPKLARGEEFCTVEEGDTLADIAARYSVQVKLLMKRNNIANENQVHLGQELVIPSRTALHVVSSEARETMSR